MMEEKIRLGLIGAGGIARNRHLPVCASLSDLEIVAVYDAVESAARSAALDFNIPHVYTDCRQLLESSDIDAVIITAPNFHHAPLAIEAMKCGKHVLCEKPMASTLLAAEEMLRIQQDMKRVLMIAMNNRFRTEIGWIRSVIQSGELGEIYHAKTGWMRRAGIPGWGGWFTSKEMSGGGPLIDIGVHMLDLSLWLMGNPEPVSVSGATYRIFGDRPDSKLRTWNVANSQGIFDVEDFASSFIRFSDGSTLTLDVSWAANIENERRFLHLFGTKGGIKLENDQVSFFGEKSGQLIDLVPQFNSQKPASRQPFSLEREGGVDMLREFARAIRAGIEQICTATEGVRVMRVLDALYRSSQEGKEILLRRDRG